MLKTLKTRWQQGYRTASFPAGDPGLPERFRGRPVIHQERCDAGCASCVDVCPTQALTLGEPSPSSAEAPPRLALDLGRCLFCNACVAACPDGAIEFTRDHRLAATGRGDLVIASDEASLVTALEATTRRLFGRSLKLRQVSAGGCSGCEAELTALGNVVFDLSRFGIQFVASPRHADGLVITGPVTAHMREALKIAYDAVPGPKIVIAIGACAISGGPFVDSPDAHNGAASTVPVDLYVPGCPPHPLTILDGLLRLLGRLDDGRSRPASLSKI